MVASRDGDKNARKYYTTILHTMNMYDTRAQTIFEEKGEERETHFVNTKKKKRNEKKL